MAENPYQGPDGKFRPGNPGMAPGTRHKAPRNDVAIPPRITRKAIKDNAAAVQTAAAKHMLKALQCLGLAAESDPASAERFLRLVAPPAPPRVFLQGTGHLAGLPAEDRLAALSAMVARGEIDVAGAESLSRMIRAEIEFRYVKPLKQAVKELELALKSGDRKAAEDALFRLSKELGLVHTRTVEGEVVDG